ncbi:hypothetical protein ACQ4LE_004232 [Meloidogyne hapla]
MFKNYLINILIIFNIIASLIKNSEEAGFCKFPPAKNTTQISKTIPVKVMTDFEFARYVATEQLRKECSVDACANSQNIIEVEDGGTVKNVIIADGSKGIWCKGSCTLENVYFEKTCYHAADLGNSLDSTQRNFKIIGGAVTNALDKIFTQSGAGTTTITGFCAENFGKLWRSCGEGCKQHTRNVIINNSKFKGPGLSIISLNKNYQDTMKISNIKLYGQICFGCQDYIGIEGKSNNMQPTDQCTPLENCQKNVCKYQASDFIKDASFETCPSGLKQN